jgi:aryl-alcohol dehydrogenase-like predicted oxidoreductase
MELALGTVQFGLAYGAVGSGRKVEPEMARAILTDAWQRGVRTLDTAAAYGDIEAQLLPLCGTSQPFRIISKIAALRSLEAEQRQSTLRLSIRRSLERLGERLDALLFHSTADLLAADGDSLWALARQCLAGRPVRLGVSCYAPDELAQLRERFDIEIAQLPGNALDQRLNDAPSFDGIELHLRSAFLQGLLLAPERGAQRVPAAASALAAWQARCAAERLEPTVAALGIAQGLPGVKACVVGVETLTQWRDVAGAWARASALHWPELAVTDPAIYDPRAWTPS